MVCIKQSTFRQFQFNFKFAINLKQNNDETSESPAKKIIIDHIVRQAHIAGKPQITSI